MNVDSNNHIMSEILNHEPVIVDSPEKNQNFKSDEIWQAEIIDSHPKWVQKPARFGKIFRLKSF